MRTSWNLYTKIQITKGEMCMDVYDFQDIKARVRLRLIKADSSMVQIKKVPYMNIEHKNLRLVFYVELGRVQNVDIGFYISNKHLKMWNISIEQLLECVVVA